MTPYGNGSSANSLTKDFELSDRPLTKNRNSSGPKLYLAETLMSMVTGWRICHHREQTLSAVRKEWFKPVTHETTNTIKSVTYLRDVCEPPYRKLKIEHDFPSWIVFATSSIVKINTGCVTVYCFAHKAMLLWAVCSRSWVALHVSEIGLLFAGFKLSPLLCTPHSWFRGERRFAYPFYSVEGS